jgi:serralysin
VTVGSGQFGPWTAISAEQTAGGYEVAWKVTGADQYTVWNTDSSGNFLSNIGVVSGGSIALQSLEASFHQDLNSDGRIGLLSSPGASEANPTAIEANGSISMVQIGYIGAGDVSAYLQFGAGPTNSVSLSVAELRADFGNVGTLGLDAGPAPVNDEIGNGGSGSENLALMTNYIASMFVTPASAGTGAIVEAQSSGQDILTKPAA